jgi:hypothetical protein
MKSPSSRPGQQHSESSTVRHRPSFTPYHRAASADALCVPSATAAKPNGADMSSSQAWRLLDEGPRMERAS